VTTYTPGQYGHRSAICEEKRKVMASLEKRGMSLSDLSEHKTQATLIENRAQQRLF
jgi:lambda repressor-like predicted transcriptional regulator